MKAKGRKLRTVDLAYMALCAALIAVCSWISVPIGEVPFTMQTFAVFAALGLLGGMRGMISVCVYLLMGLVGLPVFAGFKGGPSALLGPTGGYLIGFIGMAAVYWLMTALLGDKRWVRVAAMALGLAVCYAFGTAWFVIVYSRSTGAVGWGTALGWCVIPYILPDLIKLALALALTDRLAKHLK